MVVAQLSIFIGALEALRQQAYISHPDWLSNGIFDSSKISAPTGFQVQERDGKRGRNLYAVREFTANTVDDIITGVQEALKTTKQSSVTVSIFENAKQDDKAKRAVYLLTLHAHTRLQAKGEIRDLKATGKWNNATFALGFGLEDRGEDPDSIIEKLDRVVDEQVLNSLMNKLSPVKADES